MLISITHNLKIKILYYNISLLSIIKAYRLSFKTSLYRCSNDQSVTICMRFQYNFTGNYMFTQNSRDVRPSSVNYLELELNIFLFFYLNHS